MPLCRCLLNHLCGSAFLSYALIIIINGKPLAEIPWRFCTKWSHQGESKCPDARSIDKPVPYDTWVNKHPSSFTNLPIPKKKLKKRLIYKSILSFPRPGENISKTLPTKSQGQNCLPRCCCSNSTSNLTDFLHLPSSKWTLDSLRCLHTQ